MPGARFRLCKVAFAARVHVETMCRKLHDVLVALVARGRREVPLDAHHVGPVTSSLRAGGAAEMLGSISLSVADDAQRVRQRLGRPRARGNPWSS